MASVDIAVPCYQYGRFLRDCVGSVLNQGIVDVRVLVIDNASTDNTMRVARDLAIEDARVEVVAHRTNLGHHASFNEGIDWAAADYFMVLCADDLLAPGSLARAISVMEQNPDVHLTYGRALFASTNEAIATIDQNGTDGTWQVFAGSELLERFCRTGRCHVPGATALVRTSAQKQVGYYRPELSHTDDFEMWMRFARIGKVAETDAVQGILRLHAANRRSSVSTSTSGIFISKPPSRVSSAGRGLPCPMQIACAEPRGEASVTAPIGEGWQVFFEGTAGSA